MTCVCAKKNCSFETGKVQKCVLVYGFMVCLCVYECIDEMQKKKLSLHNKFEIKTKIIESIHSYLVICFYIFTQLKCTWHVCDENMDFNWFPIPEIIVLNVALYCNYAAQSIFMVPVRSLLWRFFSCLIHSISTNKIIKPRHGQWLVYDAKCFFISLTDISFTFFHFFFH